MTPLRQKMIRELQLHRKSPRTVEAYVAAVAQLAQHYGRSPDAISIEEVRDFLHYLITERKVAFSTCNQKLAGIRFFYHQVLRQDGFELRVPAKRSGRLPEPLSRSEIAPSARPGPRPPGWQPARKNSCRCPTSTTCSRCRTN